MFEAQESVETTLMELDAVIKDSGSCMGIATRGLLLHGVQAASLGNWLIGCETCSDQSGNPGGCIPGPRTVSRSPLMQVCHPYP